MRSGYYNILFHSPVRQLKKMKQLVENVKRVPCNFIPNSINQNPLDCFNFRVEPTVLVSTLHVDLHVLCAHVWRRSVKIYENYQRPEYNVKRRSKCTVRVS